MATAGRAYGDRRQTRITAVAHAYDGRRTSGKKAKDIASI